MTGKLILATIIISMMAIRLTAAEYYVDSENGDDDASGKTPKVAWKSLARVNRAGFLPGDIVRFKRGSSWRGQLWPKSGESGAPIVYTSYGDGEKKPSLMGSVPLDKESDWIDDGNRIWSTKPDTVRLGKELPEFANLKWGRHQEGGASVGMENIPSQQGPDSRSIYRFHCKKSGEQPNHIQLIVSGFPVEADKRYMLRFRAKSTKPFTIPEIKFSEPGTPWDRLGAVVQKPGEIGSDWTDCEIQFRCDIAHEKARLTLSLGGALPPESEMMFHIVGLFEATLETNGIRADVGNIILDGNKAAFKKWTRDALKNPDDFWFDLKTNRVYYLSDENPAKKYKSIEAALHRHIVIHSMRRHVVFDDLDIRYGAAHGFFGSKLKHCVYRNLDISWIGGADQYQEGAAGRRVRFGNGIEFWGDVEDCVVENCRIWEIYDAALTNQGKGRNYDQRNVTYRNNTIWNCEYSFEYWNREPGSRTENVLFEGNICVDAGFGWGHVQRPNKNGRHVMIFRNQAKTKDLIIRNNIFCRSRQSSIRIDSDFRDGLTMEHNTYWEKPGHEVFRWLIKNTYNTGQFTKYQEEVGLDKTSKLEKPDLGRYASLPPEKQNEAVRSDSSSKCIQNEK